MGRRKHKIYMKEWNKSTKQISRIKDTSTSPLTASISPAFPRNHEKAVVMSTTITNPAGALLGTLYANAAQNRNSSTSPLRLKRKLVRVCALSAAMNWIATILGYLVIQEQQQSLIERKLLEALLKGIVYFVSFLQAVLIISYWDLSLRYTERIRCAMKCSKEPIPKLQKSPKAMLKCTIEIAMHLVVPIPNMNSTWTVAIFGSVSEVSIDELLYFVVLIRNYHSLRLLYWYSRFSNVETQFFASVANIRIDEGFLFRCFLAEYHMMLIIGIFGIMVMFSGIIEYVFEKTSTNYLSNQWNVFWIVTTTQVTIGYGDSHSSTFFGQVTMLISCFFGVFTLGLLNTISSHWLVLNLTECNLYSELLYRKHKKMYKRHAALLVQSWWRLMLMRKSHTISGHTIVTFYSQLRAYRSTLVECQHVKDTRFERQIEAFDKSTHQCIRPLNEYLRPVIDNHSLVPFTQILDIIRNDYRIKTLCRSLYKQNRRYRSKDESVCIETFIEEEYETMKTARSGKTAKSGRSQKLISEHTGQEKAKAKITAYQNVIGRLIKDDTFLASNVSKSKP